MARSYFVTGATGAQGGAVVRALLAAGQGVHALVRDPSSATAQALSAAGAIVFKGSFDDVAAMTGAARGCTGVFVNVSPVMTDIKGQSKHVANVLAAASAAGVKHAVYSSTGSLGDFVAGRIDFEGAHPFMKANFEDKLEGERLTQRWGEQEDRNWAVVRPPRLLNSYVAPAAVTMYPSLKEEGVLRTALRPEFTQTVLDPNDVGRAVAEVFLKEDKWGRVLALGAEDLTLAEIVEAMDDALGGEKRAELQYYTPEQVKNSKGVNVYVAVEIFLNKNGQFIPYDERERFGFEMGSAKDFFKREIDPLRKALPQ